MLQYGHKLSMFFIIDLIDCLFILFQLFISEILKIKFIEMFIQNYHYYSILNNFFKRGGVIMSITDSLNDLWSKMQSEFNKINEKMDQKFKEQEEKFNKSLQELEERVDQKFIEQEQKFNKSMQELEERVDQKFIEQEQKFNKSMQELEERVDQKFIKQEEIINNKFKEQEEKSNDNFNKIYDKLDIIINVNLAQILNEQTRTRIELNKKIDDYIATKNEFENKRKIANE